jgi:hypothetical protein
VRFHRKNGRATAGRPGRGDRREPLATFQAHVAASLAEPAMEDSGKAELHQSLLLLGTHQEQHQVHVHGPLLREKL